MGADRRTHSSLVERIYEAAALPHLWPAVLQDISDGVGGVGATLVTQSETGVSITASPGLDRIVADYIAEGWATDPDYAAPLLAEQYPGFCAETHYRTVEQIERLPVHVQFLAPRGLNAGVGTVLQGACDDMIHVAIEGMPSHDAAQAAVPWLDELRGSLGRAISLTARLRDGKAQNAVAALQVAGVGAAVISGEGTLRAINDRFASRLGDQLRAERGGALFIDRFLNARIKAVSADPNGHMGVFSLPIRPRDDLMPCAVHLLPLRGQARDVFGWDGLLVLLAEPSNTRVPGADLLRLLFDLTPAEARLTRLLVGGSTLVAAARSCGVVEATARAQLKGIFAKTGVSRQADLIILLAGLGAPDSR